MSATIGYKNAGGRPSRKPSVEALNELYVVQGKTAAEIAEKYGVSISTVRGWIYRYRHDRKE